MSARDYDAKVTQLDATGLRLVSLDEFLMPPEGPAHLVESLIPADAIVVVFGPAKSGKTFAVCDLMMHAAHGMHWHGHTISRALRVVVLAGEGRNGLRVRLKAWREHHTTELRSEFFVLPESLSLPARRAEVLASLRVAEPDVVVLDTLNAYFGGGDENATQDMTAFVAAVRSMRDELKCSVVVIHHTGHAEVSRERGSSVLRAAADVLVHVARDESATGLIAFQVIEARDLEPWETALSLRLTPVAVEWRDGAGDQLSTCVIEAGGQPACLPGRHVRPLGDAQATLLREAKALAKGRETLPSREVLLSRAEVNTAAQAAGVSKSSASSAWRSLASRKLVRLVEPSEVAVRPDP